MTDKKILLKKMKRKLELYKKEREEYLDGWKRAKADLVNYKKDELKRTEKMVDREKANFLTKILLILDNFNRAEEEAKKSDENDGLVEGFLKIKEQVEALLSEEHVKEIACLGEDFNPLYHEAIEMIDEESLESGKIAEVLQKGYMYKDEVLRPAKVKVIK